MDYEEITDEFIQKAMQIFELNSIFQEFIDSIIEFNNFSRVSYDDFLEYLNKLEE
ncbi:MAG: hypothetical protein ACTSX0_04490 [Promethearchaeota archaeon]